MKELLSRFLCLLVIIFFCAGKSVAQTWDLRGCNTDSVAYPFENGRGTMTFPLGSCPPPKEIVIACFNNSKIKPVKAESQSHETYYTHIAEYAIDEHMVTRWSAGNLIDSQWFQVDMGKVKTVRQVVLTWELAYATDYLIQSSADKVKWVTAAEVKGSDGFIDKVNINTKARYIRMQSVKKANQYGVSLFDFTLCAEAEEDGPKN